jgi:hypothetical protein
MLNNHNRVAHIHQRIQLHHQLVNVRRMQTGRRLIENVKRIAPLRTLQLSCNTDGSFAKNSRASLTAIPNTAAMFLPRYVILSVSSLYRAP